MQRSNICPTIASLTPSHFTQNLTDKIEFDFNLIFYSYQHQVNEKMVHSLSSVIMESFSIHAFAADNFLLAIGL